MTTSRCLTAGRLAVNHIYRCDCLEGMKLLPDRSVDMILSDLPYGITANPWDSIIDLDRLWIEFKRIIRPTGAIVSLPPNVRLTSGSA